MEGLRLNSFNAKTQCNYSYFPIVVEEKLYGTSRNEIYDYLAQHDICARKYFYPLTSDFDCFHGRFDSSLTPVAVHMSKRVLSLPLYADLEMETVDRICELILQCKK